MKAALLFCVVLLAGPAFCSAEEDSTACIPDWIPDDLTIPDWILELVSRLPDSLQEIINRLPEIVAAVPGLIDRIPEIIDDIIQRIPEIIPIIIDRLPEIIAQVPAILDRIGEIIGNIIEKIPELIPIILEKIPDVIAALPEIREKIKEILENLDLPDWFPDLEKPDWWPDSLPTIPEYNRPVPGTIATIDDFPGIVQIEIGTGSVWTQGCAGSVVTSVHVVTAARCFTGLTYNPRFRRVRAGSAERFTGGTVVQVDFATNHPSFVSNSFSNDISVVRLLSPLLLGSTIQQTPIVQAGFVLPTGINVINAGFGSTAQGAVIADRNLYQIELSVVDCSERWSKIPIIGEQVTDANVICVARSETGGRNGDIRDLGAPIFYQNILVGLEIYGALANQTLPIVVTPVSSFTNWIVENAV